MPVSRYRLRHTRRGRQANEAEQVTVGDDVRDMPAIENEVNDDDNEDSDTPPINGRFGHIQGRDSQTENERGRIGFIEMPRTQYRRNEGRINSQDTEQTYPYFREMAMLERDSRNGRREFNRPTTFHNDDVSSRSRENVDMAVMEVSGFQDLSQGIDEQELPSDVKYVKLQGVITPDIEQKNNTKCSIQGHRRRSSSCDLNITFTRSNENTSEIVETRDLKDDLYQYLDSDTTADKQRFHLKQSPECFRNQSVSDRDQIVEVTCRSASNSSTFYNIVSYSDKTHAAIENLKEASRELGDKGKSFENRNVTKRDVATNTDDSFSETEFDFPETESGKVSQNSIASDKIYQISLKSGQTTASSNEFGIPDWRQSKVSTPIGTANRASKYSDSNEKGKESEAIDNDLEHHKDVIKDIKDVIEIELCPVKHNTTVTEDGTSKHICTQTGSQNHHADNKEDTLTVDHTCLDSSDNDVKAKVDSWQKDWIPACEYRRNENVQIFSKFMHFDQVSAKVQTWKNNWEPAWLKPREQINLNTNKDFLMSLKNVGSRIDTGTRNTVGNPWSRYSTHKSKIKSAPVNKKKPPCPLGPRRTRD